MAQISAAGIQTAECRVLSDCASMVCGYCMANNKLCSYGQ